MGFADNLVVFWGASQLLLLPAGGLISPCLSNGTSPPESILRFFGLNTETCLYKMDAENDKARIELLLPEMIHIPAGEFVMGSDPRKDPEAKEEELPKHTLYLPTCCLSKAPVTNLQYAAFVEATSYAQPAFFQEGGAPPGKEDHPVVYVSWHDAMAYCRWLSETTGRDFSLPSEAEWEKGARGTDGRIYPWGNSFNDEWCNCSGEDTTAVGFYPSGNSPYGLTDMLGNVWEWTRSLWGKEQAPPEFSYAYDPEDGRENLKAVDDVKRVVRGGSFNSREWLLRCSARYADSPLCKNEYIGFRVLSHSP